MTVASVIVQRDILCSYIDTCSFLQNKTSTGTLKACSYRFPLFPTREHRAAVGTSVCCGLAMRETNTERENKRSTHRENIHTQRREDTHAEKTQARTENTRRTRFFLRKGYSKLSPIFSYKRTHKERTFILEGAILNSGLCFLSFSMCFTRVFFRI